MNPSVERALSEGFLIYYPCLRSKSAIMLIQTHLPCNKMATQFVILKS